MKNIGELFTKYGSDKDAEHHYGQYYQKHLPNKINKLLEIGVWKGGSVKAFQEFYDNEGEIHTINYVFGGEIISIEELKKIGVIPHRGSQDDVGFLRSIKDVFTVIVDDGSHHSDSQITSFKQLFVNNLESGGWYVIEDVYGHLPDPEGAYWRRGKVNSAEDTIMGVLRRLERGLNLVSQFFTKEESDLITPLLGDIKIYDDKIIFINKK